MEDIDKTIAGIKSKIETYKGWVEEEKIKLEAYEALKERRLEQCSTDID
tara:strand:+ start:827 stop:973 length:147 start_codon:yes stop_codon:yes gene_type:complete